MQQVPGSAVGDQTQPSQSEAIDSDLPLVLQPSPEDDGTNPDRNTHVDVPESGYISHSDCTLSSAMQPSSTLASSEQVQYFEDTCIIDHLYLLCV